MNMKQKDKAMNKLNTGLNSAAAIFTQQPGIISSNNGIKDDVNNTIIEETTDNNRNGLMEEVNNEINTELNIGIAINNKNVRRGPKKKGDFKKVTLNLEVDLNLKLDEYILGLKQQALKSGKEAPSKSEWVRDVVEEKLRELGVYVE